MQPTEMLSVDAMVKTNLCPVCQRWYRVYKCSMLVLIFHYFVFQIYIMLCLNFDFYIIPLTLLLTFLKQYVMCMLLADKSVNLEEQVCCHYIHLYVVWCCIRAHNNGAIKNKPSLDICQM